jgi:signal transduction histidine kinase
VFLVGNLESNSVVVMYNSYSEKMRAATVDYAIDNCTRAQTQCTVASDFIYIVQDSVKRPATLIMHPVYATEDGTGENVTTAMIVGVFNWDDLIGESVPRSAERGIEATIRSNGGDENTYVFKDGVAEQKKRSSDHSYRSRHAIQVDFEHTSYTIHLQFTEEFVRQYRTWAPLLTAVTILCISLFISVIIIWYDIAMNKQKKEQDIVSETKRLFVRYISHEIRTPLNTVHLGLQTLNEEIQTLVKDNGTFENTGFEKLKPILEEWSSFISSIDDSTADAITVVSDLIDFDKLTRGMLNIELGVHGIWNLVTETVKPFKIQARSKDITIDDSSLHAVVAAALGSGSESGKSSRRIEPIGSNFLDPNLVIYGDSNKLQQVIRNLVSNAMKFTPENGKVTVTGHNPTHTH